MQDLWPEIKEISELKAPVNILKEQASNLGNKTNNLVTAEVVKSERNPYYDHTDFTYAFHIVAPALDFYRYELFVIAHNVELYPLQIRVEDSIRKKILEEGFKVINEREIFAETEEEFTKILKIIFNAEKTIKVINSIIAQTK